jgi:hypothetical protein
MPSLSFVSLSRSDKSFQVGLILVVLFAVVEFFAASVHYLGRTRPAQPAVAAPRVAPAPLSSVAPSAPPVALAVASPTANARRQHRQSQWRTDCGGKPTRPGKAATR